MYLGYGFTDKSVNMELLYFDLINKKVLEAGKNQK